MTVPEKWFLQASMALPLGTPILVAPILILPVGYLSANSLPRALAGITLVSFVYGGVPYVIFAGAVLFLTREWTAREIARLAWRVPPLFGAFAGLVVGALVAWSLGGDRVRVGLVFGGLSFAASIVLGYAYVGLVLGGRYALKTAGILSPDPDDSKDKRVPRRREALG